MAPLTLLISLIYVSYSYYSKTNNNLSLINETRNVAFAALPSNENLFAEQIGQKDARAERLKQFFSFYNSPLEPFSQYIVAESDKQGLDYRLLPAIAMQESNLCRKAPKDSYNCWGFGIYGKKTTRFTGYGEAIKTITKTLAKEYKGKGLVTPREIMSLYTPSSNGSWASSVDYFMNMLR